MSTDAISGVSMNKTSGNKYVDAYKKLQKFKDEFAGFVSATASGHSPRQINSVFESRPTAAGQL